jgi:ribosomal protein L16 Arg81 hydroxylase
MSLQILLGDRHVQRFIAEHYQRLPYSSPGGAAGLCELGTWETLSAILACQNADTLVCRSNARYEGPSPRTAGDAQRLIEEGYTLLVRHAERLNPRLAELAKSFERDLAAPVNVHMYCTPAGEHGFGWHYDAEEVFIVQTTGRKEYLLRKNTVNPWPIEETLPADMRYEREIMPLVRCELAAGDWLYIPSGYWHMAKASETAISLAIGVMPRTAVDLYGFLRRRIVESLLWRQRLPVMGATSGLSDEELAAAIRELLPQLRRDLEKQFSDPQLVDEFIRALRSSESLNPEP